MKFLRNIVTLLGVGALASVFGASGCEEYGGSIVVACPPPEDFAAVSRVLEKRCGTLDCHGGLARPYTVYGQRGLRLLSPEELDDLRVSGTPGGPIVDNDSVAGGKATTPEEVRANRDSLCSLEPERMQEFIDGGITSRDLMILRKPLLIEKHKGGRLFIEGTAGFQCLDSWLNGATIVGECTVAAQEL